MSAATGGLRHNRDFRLLWVGQVLSTLGSNMSGIAFPLVVLGTTGSPAKAGLLALVSNAPFVLLQLPAGVYVDRWNRRTIMIGADIGRALALATLTAALWFGHTQFALLLVVAAVEGSLAVVFRLAEGAALRAVIGEESQLSEALALNQARSYGASLAGRPLGGLLFGIRIALPFLLDAVSYAASLLTVAALKTPLPAPPHVAPRHVVRGLREGFSVAWNNRFLRSVTMLTTGSDFVINAMFLVVVVAATSHGAPAVQVGVMFAISGLGGMLGALAAPWFARRVRSLRLVAAGAVWLAIPFVALTATTTNPILLGVLLGLALSIWPLYHAVVVARWMTQVPEALMGRVQGAVAVFGWAPVPLAPFVAGLLLEWTGVPRTVLILTGVLVVVAVAITMNDAIRDESRARTAG